jgi:hypothetical protein
MEQRLKVVEQVEAIDAALRESGMQLSWFRGADQQVLDVAGEANGYLFEQLLIATGYHDVRCVEMLRTGLL